MTWRDPRVMLFAQYLCRDDPVQKSGGDGGWQSGPLYANVKAKPALKHFADPFALDASRHRLWGQVRARNASSVTVQRRLKGSKTWKTVKTVRTDGLGYWSWRTSLRKGASYRFQAAGATSS